jgi:hypothetical protein
MSRKVFTAGEVLAAADVNSFLMDQTVMSFAGTAARGSAIPSPVEGMYTHLEDTDRLEFWNGSAWRSPFGATLISSVSPAAVSTFAMNNIFSSEYDNYVIFLSMDRSASATLNFQMTAGGVPNTSGNYVYVGWDVNQSGGAGILGALATTSIQIQGAATPNIPAEIKLFDPFKAKPTRGHNFSTFGDGAMQMSMNIFSLRHAVSTSYDGLLWSVSSGTMTGTIQVYGMRK